MKSEKLYDGITGIRDELVDQAAREEKKKGGGKKRWTGMVAAVVAVAMVGGILLRPEAGGSSTAYALAQAVYPEMSPYPNEMEYIKLNGEFDDEKFEKVYDAWSEDQEKQRREDYAQGLENFFADSAARILGAANGENLTYSPLNIYMALGMLAELTDGNSRQQILDLLGSDSIQQLRQQAADLWNASYCMDGAVSSVLASSLWLSDGIEFKQSTLDTLAQVYYASSYQGEMGSQKFDKALQDWLKEQTGGLLDEQVQGVEMTPDTILALATTVYFRTKWSSEFSENQTKPGTFHGTCADSSADFMYKGDAAVYYWGERFGAVAQHLENGGDMWFILPDEGVTPEDLAADSDVMDLVLSPQNWSDQKTLIVHRSIPKFDVTSELDLRKGLVDLGVTDVFDTTAADFTPMTEDTQEIFLSQAKHDVRVAIDEEGVTAAAYTVMAACGASMPPEEEMDFVVDRPFLFIITNRDDLPLFMGVVNQI